MRITEHIVNLSDLVLVFFDARHPEPGAMQDTLQHLVANSIHRADSNKFLYILNQIDTTAREDNPEEVFGAWQRALAQKGLTAGRFYTIYNPDVSVPIDDPALRERFETKRDADLAEINSRVEQVEIERAYRIIGALEKTARDIEDRIVPVVNDGLERWRKRTLMLDAIVFGTIFIGLIIASVQMGYWNGLSFEPSWLENLTSSEVMMIGSLSIVLALVVYIHFVRTGHVMVFPLSYLIITDEYFFVARKRINRAQAITNSKVNRMASIKIRNCYCEGFIGNNRWFGVVACSKL